MKEKKESITNIPNNANVRVTLKNSKPSQTPKKLGFPADTLKSRIEGIPVPHVESLDEAINLYKNLRRYDSEFFFFDIAYGELAWLKGRILNSLKPITRGETGILKRGEWTVFLQRFKLSSSTSENLRHIASRFTRSEARQQGYTEMVAICGDDRRTEACKSMKNQAGMDLHSNPGDSHPLASTTGSRPKTLRLAEIPKRLRRIIDSLFVIADQLPEAADLFQNPDASKELLSSFGEKFDQIENQIKALRAARQLAYDKVQEYVDEGHILGMRTSQKVA